jgi:hypothetical protein
LLRRPAWMSKSRRLPWTMSDISHNVSTEGTYVCPESFLERVRVIGLFLLVDLGLDDRLHTLVEHSLLPSVHESYDWTDNSICN